MRICRRLQREGFTLLEILITVVVLSTGLVLVLQGLHSVLYTWDGAVQRTRSFMAAQERFARLRHESSRGTAPRADAVLQVEPNVAGHAGLYRVTYRSERMFHQGDDGYELLLYVAPDREEAP